MSSEYYWQVLFIIVLIGVNGFFALAEIALVTVRPTQITSMVESGVSGAKRLQRLTRDSSRFLSTIQVAITLSGFLASASATAALAQPLGNFLATLGIPGAWSQWLSILLVTLVVSYCSLVWGELVPKQLALGRPKVWALRVVRPVEWLGNLFYPFVAILSTSTQVILKLMGVRPDEARSRLSEDELRRMVVEHRTLEVRDISREPLLVPETKKALSLIQELRMQRVHMAIVIDEYGGTAGIVTFEDLLEEIVGEIHDETDPEPEEKIVLSSENEFIVDAGLRLEDVNEELNLSLTIVDTYETLAGFLLNQFQRLPEQGETLDSDGLTFTIDEVKDNRIEKVRITRLHPGEPDESKDDDEADDVDEDEAPGKNDGSEEGEERTPNP